MLYLLSRHNNQIVLVDPLEGYNLDTPTTHVHL